MGNLTIPDLDETLAASLRERASVHGRTVEEEARAILREAVVADTGAAPPRGIGDAIHALFAPLGGVELDVPAREPVRDIPDFSR